MTATFARGDDLEVEVAGITHHWDAARALAGKRPREEDEIEREKSVKVRLVREPGNQYDSNAIAVWSDKHGHVGYVPKEIAADFGPVIDELRVLGAKELDGEAMDFYCSADLYAEWDYWDPDDDDHDPDVDKNEPERIDLTLWFKLPLNPKVTRRG